jgi:3-hydroxybutyryl-CoA dehydrogenase
MRLVVVANDELKEELLSGGINDNCKIEWTGSSSELSLFTEFDGVVDLLFEQNGYEATYLKNILPKPVFVNSINKTISEIGWPLIRINGWPGFLKRNIAEVACSNDAGKKEAERILTALNRKPEWVPDIKGFISSRVVSMIVNEAYFALEENISSKNEIDIAMKLGTNYPYGPFEWSKKIGLKNIAGLLTELSLLETRYQPSNLLLKESEEA